MREVVKEQVRNNQMLAKLGVNVESMKWFVEQRPAACMEACLPWRDLDRLIIQGMLPSFSFVQTINGTDAGNLIVLAGFTVASLEEDAYGVLQKDIPKILEAFTSYLIMLENYTRELEAAAVASNMETKAQVEEGLTRVVEPLVRGE